MKNQILLVVDGENIACAKLDLENRKREDLDFESICNDKRSATRINALSALNQILGEIDGEEITTIYVPDSVVRNINEDYYKEILAGETELEMDSVESDLWIDFAEKYMHAYNNVIIKSLSKANNVRKIRRRPSTEDLARKSVLAELWDTVKDSKDFFTTTKFTKEGEEA